MLRNRLTRTAERLAHSRIVAPFIIEAIPGRLEDILYEIRPFTEVKELFPLLQVAKIPSLGPYPVRRIRRFNMVAAILPREIVFRLAENRNVRRIYPDKQMWAFQYPTVPPEGVFEAPHKVVEKITFTSTWWTKRLIGADVANNKGFTGRGILVSVVDTGASRVHEQIRRASFESTTAQYRDENGHGTWCVSCVGGEISIDEYLSQRVARRVVCEGMAPRCGLLAVKCLGYYVGTGMTSDIIKAVDISIQRGADVISMSLGGPSEEESPEEDAFYPVLNDTVRHNIIPVVAAGNEGPSENTVASPGALPVVLTVGAYDPITAEIANFSSRGPTNWDDIKPDVIAPGVNIDSGTVGVCDTAGDGVPSRYSPISGTSMATPHVAGLVALMRESMSRLLGRVLTVDEIKRMMEQLGEPKDNDKGWGPITWQMWEQWLSTEYGVHL